MTDGAGYSAEDPPILACFAGRENGTARQLHASLSGDVAAVLLGVSSPRQDDVRARSSVVAVMSLIDHKRCAEIAAINLVGAEKVEQLDIARYAPGKNAVDIAPPGSRHKLEIEPTDAGRRIMQDVEAVPVVANEAAALGDSPSHREHLRAIAPGQCPLSEHEHRVLRFAQLCQPGMVGARQSGQRIATLTQHFHRKRQIEGRADCGDREPPLEEALAQPRINEWCLPAGVGANEQASISILDAGDCRVEQVPGTATRIELGPILATIYARCSKLGQQFS